MAHFEYWRSPASDMPMVHAGYANYRIPLLQAGVNLYGLKPVAEPTVCATSAAARRAPACTPRPLYSTMNTCSLAASTSTRARPNTEMGLVIHSPELARQVTVIAQDAMRPERSYQPKLIVETADKLIVKRLHGATSTRAPNAFPTANPKTTFTQRGLLRVLQALPIEEQL